MQLAPLPHEDTLEGEGCYRGQGRRVGLLGDSVTGAFSTAGLAFRTGTGLVTSKVIVLDHVTCRFHGNKGGVHLKVLGCQGRALCTV